MCEMKHFPPMLKRVDMYGQYKELLLFDKWTSKDKWQRNFLSHKTILLATPNFTRFYQSKEASQVRVILDFPQLEVPLEKLRVLVGTLGNFWVLLGTWGYLGLNWCTWLYLVVVGCTWESCLRRQRTYLLPLKISALRPVKSQYPLENLKVRGWGKRWIKDKGSQPKKIYF